MAAGNTGGVATTGTVDSRRPAFVELFFDLVFVVALIELEDELANQLTWAGAGQTLVLLLAFMLLWGLAAWIAHSINVGHPNFLPVVVVAMAGNLLLAATLAEAYSGRGLLFAVTYVAIQLVAGVWLLIVARETTSRVRTGRILVWEMATAVLWIVGGLVAGTARGVLWAVAIAIEYAAVALGWPTPVLGRSR
jgi:low temperature requirement protein LtrA